MKKKLTLLCLFALIFTMSYAQFFNYLRVNASTYLGAYSDLGTTGTKITTNFKGGAMANTNDNSSVQNIGFTFNFVGTNYTQFTLNTNGFIKLGNDTAAIAESDDILFSNHANSLNVIYPFNNLLFGKGTTEFRVATLGTPGSKVCIIQFKGLSDNGCATCQNPPLNDPSSKQFDDIEFQIVLHETTNVVEFVYGNFTGSLNAAAYVPFNCGLKGDSRSNSVNATKSSQSGHLATAFIDGPYTGNRFNNRNTVLPTPGFTIQFTPIIILPNNVQLQTSYIMGKVATGYNNEVRVFVQNLGASLKLNYPVTINVTGANTLLNQVVTIDSLKPGERKTAYFPSLNWSNNGKNTVAISIPNDDDNADNADTLYQIVKDTTIGYHYDSSYNGTLGVSDNSLDLAVAFKVNPPNKLMSVTTYFDTVRSYRVFVYGSNADTPKTKIYNPSANIIANTGANRVSFGTNGINVPAAGDLFVVITQTKVNESLRYRYFRESPIRPKRYYFRIPQGSTAGSPQTAWNDFFPSNPFKLLIDATFANPPTTVPVKFGNFIGMKEDNSNVLYWQTSSEINNKGFEVERSTTGDNFKKIGYVQARGDANSITNYSYTDYSPAKGINYYRLKQIDKDGAIEYSSIISIKENVVKKGINVFPNPTYANINITVDLLNKDEAIVQVFDMFGKIVLTKETNLIAGSQQISLNTANLKAGNYIVRIMNSDNLEIGSSKFVKL